MGDLSSRDVDAILEFTLELSSFEDLDGFRAGVLPGIHRLVPADVVGYNEIDLGGGTAIGITDPADALFPGVEQRFLDYAHQHPLVAIASSGDRGAHLLSDFLSVREFHRLELYQDLYRLLGTEDQIVFTLPGGVIIAIAISRSRRNFVRRDLGVAERLRPHLARAYLQVCARERARAIIEAQDLGLDERDAGLILLDRAGGVAHASEHARELLAAYCGRPASNGSLLEPSVAEWLEANTEEPLVLCSHRGRLRVRKLRGRSPTSWRALLLDEQRAHPPPLDSLRELGLTPREAQVLRLLCCGKPNDRIARELAISAGTVRKHLEHVYAKLGVESRGQAIARTRG